MRKLEHFMIPINEIPRHQEDIYEKRVDPNAVFSSFRVCGELSSYYDFEPLYSDAADFMHYKGREYEEYLNSGDLDYCMNWADTDITAENGYQYIDYATSVVRAVRDSLQKLLSNEAVINESKNTECLRQIIENFQKLYPEEDYFSDPSNISWYELDAFIEYYYYETDPKFTQISGYNNGEEADSREFLTEIIEETRIEFIKSLQFLLEKGELTNQLLERAKEICSTVKIDITDPLVELVQNGPVRGDWAVGYFVANERAIYLNHELLKYNSEKLVENTGGELVLEDVYIPNLQKIIFHELVHAITARWYSAWRTDNIDGEKVDKDDSPFRVDVHTAFPRFLNEALTENLALELYKKQFGQLDFVNKSYEQERVILGLLVNCLDLEKANTTPDDFFSSLRKAWLDSCSGIDTVEKPLSSYGEFFGTLHKASFSGILNRLAIIDEQLGVSKVLQILSSSRFDPHEKLVFDGLLSRKDLNLINRRRKYIEIDDTLPYSKRYEDYRNKNNQLLELSLIAQKLYKKAKKFQATEIDLKYGYGDGDFSPLEKMLMAILGEKPERSSLTKQDIKERRQIYTDLKDIIAQMRQLI